MNPERGSTGIRTSQLRHALRTPLNHIAGYTDMLLEELAADAPEAVRSGLEAIRETGHEILDLLQRELPADQTEISHERLDALQTQLHGLLEKVSTHVGDLAARAEVPTVGLNLPDVQRIGAAVAELSELLRGGCQVAPAAPLFRAQVLDGRSAATGEILVVDDNPGNRDLLARVLERHGFSATPETGGEAALNRVARQTFDLVLLDLMMPGVDGLEVLQRLKADPMTHDLPVIMLSALDETARVIQCLEMGAEDYLIKPFDPVLLIARIRSTLERSRLRAAQVSRSRELESAYTRLRENERRLQESEERLRLATEAGEVGIWYYYTAQNRVIMTPVCKGLFGFPRSEESLTFEQLNDAIHPEDRERAVEQVSRAVNSQTEYNMEYRVVWPDGSTHWLTSRGSASAVAGSPERRLAGVAIDISGRKQAEEAVRQAGKLESIGLLAGGIAHDFNNLLTGIIGSASFVLDNLEKDDANTDMLRNIVDAGERAADLTQQLLAYSGKGKFKVQRLDLSKIANDISILLRASIPRMVGIERQLEANLPPIEGDATQIQQIIMNLMINGSEAITGEGNLCLRTGLTRLEAKGRERFVFGEHVAPGEYVYVEVQDTGSGMDQEILHKIFDPFFTTKFTGRGLGLAAVFGIVRGHEGALEVHTAPGQGSTFRTYFPLAKAAVQRTV